MKDDDAFEVSEETKLKLNEARRRKTDSYSSDEVSSKTVKVEKNELESQNEATGDEDGKKVRGEPEVEQKSFGSRRRRRTRKDLQRQVIVRCPRENGDAVERKGNGALD